MTMSPFIIYAIVLNIAYILYYATIITMDMHAKPKDAENQTETISMDNDQESQETAIMPKTVTEDPFTGNFNIAEATELVRPAEEAPEDATSDNREGQTEGNEDENPEGGMSDDDGGEVAPAIDPSAEEGTEAEQASASEAQQGIEEAGQEETGQTENSEQADNTDPATQPEAEEASEAAVEEEGEEENDNDDEEDGFTTVPFSDTLTLTDTTEQDDDISKAFDPDLALPKFGVTSIVGLPTDTKVEETLNSVNTKLIDNIPNGNFMEPAQLAAMMRGKREEGNIAYKDEYTKC
mgnify:CR=1 FL=1